MRRNKTIGQTRSGSRPMLIALLALAQIAGCATDRGCQNTCLDSCPEACSTDCLPKTSGQEPPKATLAGWERCVEQIPKDAVPAPPGTYINAWREATSAAAQQHHWVITRNEWFSGGEQLSPDGRQHVKRIAAAMLENPNWVVIENEPVQLESGESYDQALERIETLQSTRRQAVVDGLVASGVAEADRWIIFAEDRNVGVRGIEAPQIYNRQFQGIGGGNRRGNRRGGRGGLGGGFGGGVGGGFGGGFGGGMGGGGFGGGGIF